MALRILLLIPLFIVQIILANNIHGDWKQENKIDKTDSILFMILIILLVYGLADIVNGGLFSLIASLVIGVLFILYEKNKKNQVYNLSLFKNINYVIGNFATFTFYFVTFIATYILSLYLQVGMGFTSNMVGLIMLTTPIITIFISFVSGRLSDKYDSRILTSIALMILLSTLIILEFLENIPFYLLIIALILQGIGHGMF